jgi:hypothetical protein
MAIGGCENWRQAVGASKNLKNIAGQEIRAFCLLDPDYRCDAEKEQIVNDARRDGLQLYFWSKKEIENFFIIPEVIARLIHERTGKAPKVDTIVRHLETILEDMKGDIVADLSAAFYAFDRKNGVQKASKGVTALVNEKWKTLQGKIDIAPGKKVFGEIAKFSQQRYGTSVSPMAVARSMKITDVNPEVKAIVTAIEKNHPL